MSTLRAALGTRPEYRLVGDPTANVYFIHALSVEHVQELLFYLILASSHLFRIIKVVRCSAPRLQQLWRLIVFCMQLLLPTSRCRSSILFLSLPSQVILWSKILPRGFLFGLFLFLVAFGCTTETGILLYAEFYAKQFIQLLLILIRLGRW